MRRRESCTARRRYCSLCRVAGALWHLLLACGEKKSLHGACAKNLVMQESPTSQSGVCRYGTVGDRSGDRGAHKYSAVPGCVRTDSVDRASLRDVKLLVLLFRADSSMIATVGFRYDVSDR